VNPRVLWAAVLRWYAAHSERDRRILLGVAVAAGLSLVYVGVVQPVRAYRRHVAEEIGDGLEELERSARFLGAADGLRAEREQLAKRLEQAKTRLLPGDSGTLGAAALQERTNALATEKGITVQSTQVMKEEPADPFHKVSVRLTLSGELKPFADFVAGLEYGPQALTIPFVEVSRRGAVAGQRGPRNLQSTVEVGGYLLASAKPSKPEGEGGEAEGEAGPTVNEGEGPVASAPAEGKAPNADQASPPGASTEPTAAPAAPTPPPGPTAAGPTPPPAETPPTLPHVEAGAPPPPAAVAAVPPPAAEPPSPAPPPAGAAPAPPAPASPPPAKVD